MSTVQQNAKQPPVTPAPLGATQNSEAAGREPGVNDRCLAAILESMTEACFALDAGWRYSYVNRQWEKFYGRSGEEVLGREIFDLFPGLAGTVHEEQFLRVMHDRIAVNYEAVSPVIGRWLEVRAFPAANGGVSVFLLDITERRQTDVALRASEERLRRLLNVLPVAVVTCDAAGALTFYNQRAADLWGQEPTLGDETHRFFAAPRLLRSDGSPLPNEQSAIVESIRTGESFRNEEMIIERADGTRIPILANIDPLRDERGMVVGAINAFADNTARKIAEAALREAKEAAEAASKAKDDFLATLSHELRTPLNPVLLIASEAERDQTLPAAAREDFSAIRRNVELEACLIDDLLDMTRITTGKLRINVGPLPLHEILVSTLEMFRGDFAAKRITLCTDWAAKRDVIIGDAVRLQQVVSNVIRNALKFTPFDGWIKVSSRIEPPAAPSEPHERKVERLLVEIADSGIGIASEELCRIFDAFSQGAAGHQIGGLGLGLAISRHMMELHGGTIEASSAGPGAGAIFTIALPLAPRAIQRAQHAPPGSPARLHALRILVLEDHEATRSALERLLLRRGHTVRCAGTIASGREMLAAGCFDLLLADRGLPDGDSCELMRELTRRGGIVGIALSGYGRPHDLIEGARAGFLAHLTKPIDVNELDAVMAAHFQRG